jgi:ABC-type glycerol-3-phosphate transport system substrate-binding protein
VRDTVPGRGGSRDGSGSGAASPIGRRRWLAGSAGLLGAGAFAAACASAGPSTGTQGAGGAQPGAPPPGTPRAGTKLSFASWGDPTVVSISQGAAAAFSQRFPGVEVEFIATQGQTHGEKITGAMAAGTPIHVFYLEPNDTPTYAARGQLRPLDDLIGRDRYDISDFFEQCLAQYLWKGKRYALPRGFGNQEIYYNTALWDAAGLKRPPYDWKATTWTVDEFLEATTRLTRSDADGQPVWGWNQGTGLRQWAPWVWIFGGDILDKEGTTCTLDHTPAVEGLQFLQDLIHKHRVMPPPGSGVNTLNAFGAGTLAAALGIPANLRQYRATSGLQWDVAPMPRKQTRLTSGGGVAWHMAAGVPEVNAAWELLKWLVATEFQLEECQKGLTAPPRRSLLHSSCFVDRSQPPQGIDVLLQAPEFVHPDPQAIGWSDVEQELNRAFGALWDGSRTARQVAQELVPQVNRVLKEQAR